MKTPSATLQRGFKKTQPNKVKCDWTKQVLSYDDLWKLNQELAKELMKMAEMKSENITLKKELAKSEYERNRIATDLQNHRRKAEMLQKQQTPAMLKRATAYLMKKEMETAVSSVPMVKNVKTGKWGPR